MIISLVSITCDYIINKETITKCPTWEEGFTSEEEAWQWAEKNGWKVIHELETYCPEHAPLTKAS